MKLKPFIRYFGGKWRSAHLYPPPQHGLIIEPFAGAAGYAMNYADRDVLLIDVSPRIAELWRWLIAATPGDVRSIPLVDSVDDLPLDMPPAVVDLVGWSMNAATTTPRRTLSAGGRRLRDLGRKFYGFTHDLRERIATQVPHIKHWKIECGSYDSAPDEIATWFFDPTYFAQGHRYPWHLKPFEYQRLGEFCRSRRGQVIVCEQQGAEWLPFRDLASVKAGPRSKPSAEVIWLNTEAA